MKNVKKLFLNNIKLILIYCFLIIALLQYFSVPYNIYSLLKRPYEERMTREYGYCEKEGYGYTKFIMNKYNLNKNIPPTIININPTPEIYHLLNLRGELNDDEIIVINFNETKTNNIFNTQIKKQSFSSKIIDLNDYQLIHRYGNCYFLKK
jgi:hypothetical protein|tara:strand:+ start:7112 stop:7564 length:453 start_codon:yes stop_codon:yes gene_type:complete